MSLALNEDKDIFSLNICDLHFLQQYRSKGKSYSVCVFTFPTC